MRFLLFIGAFLFLSNVLFAQNKNILAQLDVLEKSPDFRNSVTELKQILSTKNLTSTERTAAQQALVHMYQNLEMWDSCLQYCYAQIALAQQSKNTFAEATFYKLIGNTFYHIPQKENAAEYWKKCIKISEKYQYDTLLEMCYHNVGVIYYEYGIHLDSTEYYFQKALKMSLKNYPKASSGTCLHKRLLGTFYARSNRIEKAERLFLEIIADCKQIKDTPLLAQSMLFYTDVLVLKKEYQKALEYSKEGLALSRKVKSIDGENVGLKFYAENLSRVGRFEEAYKAECEVNDNYKARYKDDLNKKISESEAKFKNAQVKHEQELAIRKAKDEEQRLLFIGIGMLLGIVFVSYFLFQKKSNKQKAQLQKERLDSILAGEEKERTRIAKDLHDGIVQDLTLIKLELNANIQKSELISKNELEKSIVAIDKASQEVRNIAYQMMPNTLRELGFIPAIEDLLKRILTPNKIQYDFEQIGVTVRLSQNIELSLFRITQELLNNVIKHSGASFVSVLITQKLESVTMIFEDNGKGFDVDQIQKGIGIDSLSSRVDMLHGKINFENQNGSGTMAIIKIPISDTGLDSRIT